MIYTATHEMLPRQNADELARQSFVLSLKRHVMGRLYGQAGEIYAKEAEPAFVDKFGRKPENASEAEQALDMTLPYRFTKSINRTSQEMMWQSVGETVYREADRITAAAVRLASDNAAGGSLNLDPLFQPDRVYRDVHIHLQPEGYCPDDDGSSVTVGALYESGGRLYSMGRGMQKDDSKAGAVLRWLEENRPGWVPQTIFDMGCSAGGASTVYAEKFPDARVSACDLGASMLRYAHARAESSGVPVHFYQCDAAHSPFEDESFDLIISHNLFHEISTKKRMEIAHESLRLLKPGGICIHQDVDLLFRDKSPWEEAVASYDLHYNNEPFWLTYANSDFGQELRSSGFDEKHVREARIARTSGPGHWYAFIAEKPE